jgi:hypothetical protein
VQIRNCNLYVRWGSTWYRQQQFNRIAGGHHYEHRRNGNNINPGDRRNQDDGSSVRAGNKSTAGGAYNYHWFAPSFKSINTGHNGVCGWADFRLVMHNTSGTYDLNSAKYLVNVGADYYNSGIYRGDVAIGRFLWATGDWRRTHYHNMTESAIRNSHPTFN